MKYSEFEQIIETLGYGVNFDDPGNIFVTDVNGITMAKISKRHEYEMSTDYGKFRTILSSPKKLTLYTFCRNLAETPFSERADEKRYYLTSVSPLLCEWGHGYLLKNKKNGKFYTGSLGRSEEFYQSVFTESEIERMDISGFTPQEVPAV